MTETTGAEDETFRLAMRNAELYDKLSQSEAELATLRDQHAKVMALLQPMIEARGRANPTACLKVQYKGDDIVYAEWVEDDQKFYELSANTCSKLAGMMGDGE